jgi:hypothetical protein
MGRPSSHKRSARRRGKRERMRVKKRRRSGSSHFAAVYQAVLGADFVHVKAGRKKAGKIMSWLGDLKCPPTPSSGEPVPGYGHLSPKSWRRIRHDSDKPERAWLRGTTELQIGARHRRFVVVRCQGVMNR